MSHGDLVALLPLVVLVTGTLLTIVAVSLWRARWLAGGGAGATLAVSLGSLPLAARTAPREVTPLLVMDGLALVFLAVVLAASLCVVLLGWRYLETQDEPPEEFPVLLLLATVGAALLVCSRHLVLIFLGIETLSVGLYGLIAYPRSRPRPLEAGLKYLVLAGTSSAFLLFGTALVYAATGRLDLGGWGPPAELGTLGAAGLTLLLAGLAFKLALVPFHMWTGDVYSGAPAPVTAFVATVSKAAVAAALLRVTLEIGASAPIAPAITVLAVASMLGGNLLALLQDDLKRLLAYSSVAHLGYVLVALAAPGALASEAVAFYVATYVMSTLVAFGVITVLSSPPDEARALEAYRGLFWRRPWLAAALTTSLLSLAGIPLTAGFIGKLYVVAAGVGGARWLLLAALVLGSVLGLYYYLRVVVIMTESAEGAPRLARPSLPASVTLAALVTLLVGLGAFPGPLQNVLHLALSSMS